ncbi:MAG: hypothetical protein M3020_13015 [Myxococcota bacterium]|nr:hypothetical protein [Myxococcota bacterium]
MKVFIANFGRENLLWPLCRDRNAVLTYEDADTWPIRQSGDRAAYIAYCVANKTSSGVAPTPALASRWFNLTDIVSDTAGDIWIHREKEDLWWTTSLEQPPVISKEPAPWSNPNTHDVFIVAKAAAPWKMFDDGGARLRWSGLHPKARYFLFTEATLQELTPDHAAYARALLAGGNLSGWHGRAEWTKRANTAGRGAVVTLDAKERAVARMVGTSMDTVRASLGPPALQTPKRKEMLFENDQKFRDYLRALLHEQEGLCALTDLPLQYDGEHDDPAFLCSLDRRDSDGPYAPGNLQVVCRFVNGWKGDQPDAEFRRLMNVVRRIDG